MKKTILLLVMLLVPFLLLGQDYATRGDEAMSLGNYNQAATQYKAALAFLDSQKVNKLSRTYSDIQKKLNQAERCIPLKRHADTLFESADSVEDYERALRAYRNLLAANVSDRQATERVALCNNNIARITMSRADNQYWSQLMAGGEPTEEQYRDYLNRFPSGNHAAEAQTKLDAFADEAMWAAAAESDTREAYQEYLAKWTNPLHESEARMAIYEIDDKALWESVLAADTEEAYENYLADNSNPAKNYQAQAVAKLSVLKTRTLASASNRENAEVIVRTLNEAKSVVELSTRDEELLKRYSEVLAYDNFIANPTTWGGMDFVADYPESKMKEAVSDMTARLWADLLDTYDASKADKALKYAVTSETLKYVNQRIAQAKKASKIETRRKNWSDRFQLGFGADAGAYVNFAYGGGLEFKIGASDDTFNFIVGGKYLKWGLFPSQKTDDDYNSFVTFNQAYCYAVAKFNVASVGYKGRFYVAGEAGYNFNFGSKYSGSMPSGGEYYDYYHGVADDNLVNKNNPSVAGRVGFCWPYFDLGLFYRYDLSPVYNQRYVYEQYGYYNQMESAMNNRFRVGVLCTFYFNL